MLGLGQLVEMVVQREPMTLGVTWKATVSLLATPHLEKPKGNENLSLLLEEKGPFPAVRSMLTYLFGNGASSVGLLLCLPATLKGTNGKGVSARLVSAWEQQFYGTPPSSHHLTQISEVLWDLALPVMVCETSQVHMFYLPPT